MNSKLDNLLTEQQNPHTMEIDEMSTVQLLQTINKEDQQVALAVEQEIEQIARAVDVIVEGFAAGGRLVYMGAGTSGRLGVLDASECPPTFSVPDGLVVGLIAGGQDALVKAVEGAEDSSDSAIKQLDNINLSSHDVVVGVTASGRTPYVVGGMQYARSKGCRTIGISCSPNSALEQVVEIPITPLVGPEVITGSTRMKAGTAQKLVLNMLSTSAMVKRGKVYGNLMVDVSPTNDKLRERARRIVIQITKVSKSEATKALEQTQYNVKAAIVMIKRKCSPEKAFRYIEKSGGWLKKALTLPEEDAQ